MSAPLNIQWQLVDWSKSSMALAKQLGCCYDMANQKRRQLAPHTCRVVIPWDKVKSWKAGNHDIAAELNAIRDAVPEGQPRFCMVTPKHVATARCSFKEGKAETRKPGSGLWKRKFGGQQP